MGHSVIGSRFYKTTASIQGFPTENIYELKGGTINPGATGESEEYKLQSFFGRVNYSYDDDYECYTCEINLDEDEMVKFITGNFNQCPYFKMGDEYRIVRKQM